MVTHNRYIYEKYPGRVFVCQGESCAEKKDKAIDVDIEL